MLFHADQLSDTGNRWRLEHRTQRKLHAKHFANARDDLRGQERMAAHGKEVSMDIDRLLPQHITPNFKKALFNRITCPNGSRFAPVIAKRILLKRQTINFAIGKVRNGIDHKHGGRNHVERECSLEKLMEIGTC